MKNIENAIAAIQESDYSYFGIRTIDELLTVGDTCEASRVWDDGEPTNEVLDGTSATAISSRKYNYIGMANVDELKDILENAEKNHKGYHGRYHYIIAYDRMAYGEDLHEIILTDAVVIAVID